MKWLILGWIFFAYMTVRFFRNKKKIDEAWEKAFKDEFKNRFDYCPRCHEKIDLSDVRANGIICPNCHHKWESKKWTTYQQKK